MLKTNDSSTARPILDRVCSAIRSGQIAEAMALLSEAQALQPHDGCAWNLLGVVHECRRNWGQARRAYGKAIAADKKLNAPQQNMRRMYELYTFGRSFEPISLGDHEILLRRSLEDSLTRRAVVCTPF